MKDVVLNIVTLVDAGERREKTLCLGDDLERRASIAPEGHRIGALDLLKHLPVGCYRVVVLKCRVDDSSRRTDVGIEVVFEFGRGGTPRADGNVAAIGGRFGRLPGPFKHVLDELWEISHRRSCFRNDDRPLVLLYSTT